MVDEFINIEKLELIKSVMHCQRPADKLRRAMDRDEMGSAKDALERDYAQVGAFVVVKIRLYHPVACFVIWYSTQSREPLHKGTRILGTLMPKREEQKNASNC